MIQIFENSKFEENENEVVEVDDGVGLLCNPFRFHFDCAQSDTCSPFRMVILSYIRYLTPVFIPKKRALQELFRYIFNFETVGSNGGGIPCAGCTMGKNLLKASEIY